MARRASTARAAELAFDAISIEGGLLAANWLSRVAQLKAPQQDPADYRVPKGIELRDEIGRAWRIAQAHWADFEAGRKAKAEPDALCRQFIVALLREALCFNDLAEQQQPLDLDARGWPLTAIDGAGRVPLVCAPAGSGLDTPHRHLGDEHRKRSAFGLIQEFLNVSKGALWGLCADGLTLRIVRDNASLTRPAWIEIDLARIFTESLYPDFAAAWLLLHRSRFGRADQEPASCALETWRSSARAEGTRARERLRGGFKDALLALGQGFLAHSSNQALRKALHDGTLTKKAYFGELLRLVYRLIFLLAIEERELLHPKGTRKDAEERYALGYSVKRLRDRSSRRAAHDRHGDIWEALKIVFRGLATGEPALGLPALGGLFASTQCPHLDMASVNNRSLLEALCKLCWLREPTGVSRVNWRDMGADELGHVYEGLLEHDPHITQDGRTFALVDHRGNDRKTSGSYYTPESLVQVLLDSALEPVVADAIARSPGAPAKALLELSILDPACGSGHFLLAAARRLATHVARLSASGTPSAEEYRRALRQVVSRCIFGVDLNPMAVELCKVSLWMEAVDPGLPLTFLDSHIQHGNALLGTTPALMEKGIPDAAWDPIEGDDKKTASALKKRNKAEAKQVTLDFSTREIDEAKAVARAVTDLDSESDADVAALAGKEQHWSGILSSDAYRHQKFVADAWCAAFVWPKQPGPFAEAAPTNDAWRKFRDAGTSSQATTKTTGELADQYGFFHWGLQFPQIFAKGGFDVVLGNPPWEHLELKEEEWFAQRMPDVATAPNAATRKRMIAALEARAPEVFAEFRLAVRDIEGENHLARESGRYPLCARGRINTYALFAEHNRNVLGPSGRAGFIVPPGLATDDNTKAYFQDLVAKNALIALYEFENEEFLFPGIDHRVRFIVITVTTERSESSPGTDISFANRNVAALDDPERHFSLTPADFDALNPNTRTCPTFRSRRDADINLAMYRRTGILWREEDPNGNPWGLRFMQGIFNMASDSGLFRTRSELEAAGWTLDGNHFALDTERALPLIEAKMVHHYDHRYGTYQGQTSAQANQGKLPEFDDAAHADPTRLTFPKYWVAESEISLRLDDRWQHSWLLGWRDICRSTDQRTVIASLIPRVAVGHKFPLAMPGKEPRAIACLYACLCSFVLDYAARQKVGGTSLTYFVLKQLPVLTPLVYTADAAWARGTIVRDWLLPRVLELTFTAWDLSSFARDVGDEGPPFLWDAERRFVLRAELDAAFFHLYGVSRDDAEYILDAFPIVKKNEESHGEYRTKRVVLERYDALAAAIANGTPYVSPLGPPRRAS